MWRPMLTDLPNVLTLSRIAAIPLLVVLVALRMPVTDFIACVVFSVAAITDYFDGKLVMELDADKIEREEEVRV